MIPILILSVAMAAGGQNAQAEPAWAKEVLSSRSALNAMRHTKPLPPMQGFDATFSRRSGGGAVSYDPFVDPEGEREYKQLYRGIKIVVYLADRGELEHALRSYDALDSKFPNLKRVYVDIKISLEYLVGERNLAYADMVAELAQPSTGGDRPWLLLALISSSRGQIFPGQLRYCEGAINQEPGLVGLDRRGWATPVHPLPQWRGDSPKDAEAAACVALGTRNASLTWQFLERAMRLYPWNPAIASALVRSYGWSGQFTKARALEKEMISRCTRPEDRKWFSDQLRYDEGKADMPPTKPVFDDGGA
jgi:hypothetical protein